MLINAVAMSDRLLIVVVKGGKPPNLQLCKVKHIVKGKPLRGDFVTLDNIFDFNIKKGLTITLLTIIMRVSSIAGYQNGHTYKAVQL